MPKGDDPPEGHGTEIERGLRVDAASCLHKVAAWCLHKVVVGMNRDNLLVRPARIFGSSSSTV
jgi:type I restriction enzyme R subunit